MPGKKKVKPATSKSQQRLMGMMYAYRKGKLKSLPKDIKDRADAMKLKDIKAKASTKNEDLPEKVEENLILSFEEFFNSI